MYALVNYAEMLADPRRKQAFVDAMRECIHPGDVVVDLGAGFGALAMLACRLGVARVYAIEPNPAVRVLPELMRRNGIPPEQIRILQADSRQIELPERADLIIADLRSFTPLFQGTFDIMGDACRRFLKPGGRVMPFRDTIHVAPVAQQALHTDYRLFWEEHGLGLDFSYARDLAIGKPMRAKLKPEQFLARPQRWAQVEYGEECRFDPVGRLEFVIDAPGVLDGIGFWFDLDLSPSVRLSNAPDAPLLIYGAGLLPLPEPIEVAVGDVCELDLKVVNLPDREYWSWKGRVRAADGQIRAKYSCSNLPLALLELPARSTTP